MSKDVKGYVLGGAPWRDDCWALRTKLGLVRILPPDKDGRWKGDPGWLVLCDGIHPETGEQADEYPECDLPSPTLEDAARAAMAEIDDRIADHEYAAAWMRDVRKSLVALVEDSATIAEAIG